MDKKEKDKNRNSFLDKVGGTFKIGGKTKNKSTSSANSKGPPIEENEGGDPFTESIDFDSMATAEVNERFEQLLDDMNLTEQKKAPLRNKDITFRRQMLAMHMHSRGSSKVSLPGFSMSGSRHRHSALVLRGCRWYGG
ncbi:diaphanous-related formin [Plakobranchus ocellatus]|uniref:Diaphanous-related formin n=1 Tax=Plakobranchus ocellatus TaxID=259542 RepID=A0AAV3YZ37_9GAST|nr:diaphanous-related formin [Plakobranchus ocellatus]